MTRSLRRGLGFAVFALVTLGLLISLGVWQLQRREWKTNLLTKLEASLKAAPARYRAPAEGSPDSQAREFLPVTVTGQFMAADTWALPSPTPDDAKNFTSEPFGYRLFTPLAFASGIVAIDQGFVPASQFAEVKAKIAGIHEPTTVIGLIRVSQKDSWLFPAPSPQTHVFVTANIEAMAASLTGDTQHFITSEYIEAEPLREPGQHVWPLGRDAKSLIAIIPNRHLEYALTWFGLAATLIVVFGLFARKSKFD